MLRLSHRPTEIGGSEDPLAHSIRILVDQNRELCLLPNRSGPQRRPTALAEIFVELAVRKKEEQALPNRHGLPAFRTKKSSSS